MDAHQGDESHSLAGHGWQGVEWFVVALFDRPFDKTGGSGNIHRPKLRLFVSRKDEVMRVKKAYIFKSTIDASFKMSL